MLSEGKSTAVRLLDFTLPSPCLVASSVLTGDLGRIRQAEASGCGAVSTKMATPGAPFAGQPDVVVLPAGGIVTSGDRRLDLDHARALIDDVKRKTSLVVFANLWAPAEDVAAWCHLAKALEAAGADALELDLSCPNLPGLGTTGSAAQSPEHVLRITAAVKDVARAPVLPKLTAQVVDMAEIAGACEQGGADAIVAVNGLPAAPPIDIWNEGRPGFHTLERHSFGVLTGSPIFPIACRAVADIARTVSIPVIGCGGISTWQDVVEMMMWGASAVQICSSILVDGFGVLEQLNRGLEGFLDRTGYAAPSDWVGRALAHVVDRGNARHRLLSLVVDDERCQRCNACLKPGICTAIQPSGGGVRIDHDKCLQCGICLDVCPCQAIRVASVGASTPSKRGHSARRD